VPLFYLEEKIMKLSEQAIKEYQEIFQEEHGISVSAEEAEKQGLQLLMLLDRIMEIGD
jgi:hypothetical protein